MQELLASVNETMHGLLGVLILASVMIVSFVNLKLYEAQKAFVASSFLTALVSMILVGLGILNPAFAIACWLVFALSLFF